MSDMKCASTDAQDAAWMAQIAAGGVHVDRALTHLVMRYRKPLLGFLIQRRVRPEEAEDLLQEVFIKVVRHAAGFRNESKVSSWLFQIARNIHIDHLRKASVEVTVDENTWCMAEAEHPVLHAYDGCSMNAEYLQNCFDDGYATYAQHHPQCADVISRSVHHGWSVREIAAVLERTEGATREYLSQCRKNLRKYLEPCRHLLEEA